MSTTCPNIKSPEWKAIVAKYGEFDAWRLFIANKDRVPTEEDLAILEAADNVTSESLAKSNTTAYHLKLIDALIKLTVPKGNSKYSRGDTAEVSTIRLNSKDKPYIETNIRKRLRGKGVKDNQIDLMFDYMRANNITEISTNDLIMALVSNYTYTVELNGSPTSYYSHLTAPGGTNYTENEFATPLVTPNIKGHAKFATSNGIGWFRSDEINWAEYEDFIPTSEIANPTKTRRVLEIQSDLFQKGRDKTYLTNYSPVINKQGDMVGEHDKENNFLQLLNKDNNWVTFFIKSIIQDSAKKGYKEVWFPKGETAAKIEGHETIAEELEIIQDGIDKPYKYRVEGNDWEGEETRFELSLTNSSIVEESWSKFVERLEQRKQELKSQGIEKLKPIEAFYEIKTGNILNNTYGFNNIETITDEYGNKWRKLVIDNDRDLASIKLSKVGETSAAISNNFTNVDNAVTYDIKDLTELNEQIKKICK